TGVAMSSSSPSWIRPRLLPSRVSFTIPVGLRRSFDSMRNLLKSGSSRPYRTRYKTPPASTTVAAAITPTRRRLPTTCSTRVSVQRGPFAAILESPGQALVNHLDPQGQDHQPENDPQ